jgi:DNA (cytosine-5)-methyltransferase 1
MARQNDGCLEAFPIWDDVRTFDGRPWQGIVDVVSGGFPCQDISAAGKGEGIEGERSGLWNEFARIIGEVQPSFVFVENSPMLASRGIGTVLGDLAALGFDAEWGVLGAHHSGAPHKRDRIWILACNSDRDSEPTQPVDDEASGMPSLDVTNTSGELIRNNSRRRSGTNRQGSTELRHDGAQKHVADTDSAGRKQQWRPVSNAAKHKATKCGSWWKSEPNVGRVADGVAARVDRLRCIGNGQVPAVAALAWHTLIERFNENR